MKIMRLGKIGSEQPAVMVTDGDAPPQYFSLLPLTADVDGAFLAGGGMEQVRAAVAAGTLPVLDGAETLRVGAPVARPGSVVGIGMNYAAHAAESGSAPPEIPVVFLKPSNTVAGPFDPTPVPPRSGKFDWEVELGIVIGREASYLAGTAEAAACIAGYVTANDLSEREYQTARRGRPVDQGQVASRQHPPGPLAGPGG